MSLSWRARRRWALVVLLVGLPAYIALAATLVAQFERPSPWLELGIYIGLGVVWTLPLRRIFLGIGRDEGKAGQGNGS
jgi:hypothetical protein